MAPSSRRAFLADSAAAAQAHRKVRVDLIGAGLDEGTCRQFLALPEGVRTGQPPFAGGAAGRATVKMWLRAEPSRRQNRIVTWDDLPA
jgi:hypothetical protein